MQNSDSKQTDWWDELPEEDKASIKRGMKDVEEGRTVSHKEVKRKFGI